MEDLFDELVTIAKRTTKRQGDHAPTFFLEKDGKLMVVGCDWTPDTKDKVIEAIGEMIKEKGITRYYFVSSSWMVTNHGVNAAVRQAAEEAKSTGDIVEFGKRIMALSLNPANNPAREESLQIARFDKKTGTDIISIKMERDEKGTVSFGESEKMSGTMFMRMNVWSQQQVDMSEGDDDGD